MPTDCLCATLLIAKATNDTINFWMCGDGVLALRERNTGRILVSSYDYPSGAPFYLRYLLDGNSVEQYVTRFGFCLKTTNYVIEPDGSYSQVNEYTTEDLKDAVVVDSWRTSQYDMIAMFSDGVRSFVRTEKTATGKTQHSVNFMDVVKIS